MIFYIWTREATVIKGGHATFMLRTNHHCHYFFHPPFLPKKLVIFWLPCTAALRGLPFGTVPLLVALWTLRPGLLGDVEDAIVSLEVFRAFEDCSAVSVAPSTSSYSRFTGCLVGL